MYTLNWGELTPETFLKEYWQKKPLLIKNAFSLFKDPISADELAGLAMEQEIESRIIAQTINDKNTSNNQNMPNKSWQVEHGPFESFDQLAATGWTLLVQAVNNYSRQTQALITPFNFIPHWRIDDVMVSFSTPEGGVGSHLDQYDVFIIQGEGKRRWQVGAPDSSLQSLLPHPDLKQVSAFNAIIDEITEPGDLLYIPPNHPHNGISIDNSLNYSIGFQAPNNQELWSAFADKLLDDDIATKRFGDRDRTATLSPELLTDTDITKLAIFMHSALDDKTVFNRFIGGFLTQSHHALELLIPVDPIDEAQLAGIFSEKDIDFKPVSGIKALMVNEPTPLLFINGDVFPIENNSELAQHLAKGNITSTTDMQTFMNNNNENKQLLLAILNKGFWYIE